MKDANPNTTKEIKQHIKELQIAGRRQNHTEVEDIADTIVYKIVQLTSERDFKKLRDFEFDMKPATDIIMVSEIEHITRMLEGCIARICLSDHNMEVHIKTEYAILYTRKLANSYNFEHLAEKREESLFDANGNVIPYSGGSDGMDMGIE